LILLPTFNPPPKGGNSGSHRVQRQAQFGGGFGFGGQNFGNGQGQGFGGQASNGGGQVHDNFRGKAYHFSWLAGGSKMTHGQAANYCRQLGGGWQMVSIESGDEDRYIVDAINRDNVEYIWTSATRSGNGWAWGNGQGMGYTNWGRVGRFPGVGQPDNAEGQTGRPENCLGILNRVYPGDGVTWHDIACYHQKPTVCERN